MGPGKYPREAAVRALTRVLSDRQTLEEALAAMSGEIPAEARGWLHEIVAGTLRWKGRLDLAIDSAALKKKPSGWLRKVLLVGAYQLVGQERTDPVSAVHETVNAVKKKEGEAPAKFANAVLRRVSEHAREWRELAPPAEGAPLEESAAWASLPPWLWKRIVAERGAEFARAFAQASLERPRLWLRARRADWKPANAEPGPVAASWIASGGGRIPEKEGFVEGEFIVQDISSQRLVAEIHEAVSRERGAGFSALDLCAAPGGKSVGLAWSGARVTSTDRDEARMRLLKDSVERAAPTVRILGREQVRASEERFDLVWVDAPCTGTGIVRRHPDVRWLRAEGELAKLRETQLELAREGWTKVAPGGFFAYSVCSVLEEEGMGLVREAIGLKPEREWFLVPQETPFGDGFWAALFRRPN